jgi:cytoskeletal protein RodZ
MSFELGAALRQAREERQLAFEEVAAATRIHPRFLAALEAERFETLPGRAYARSFLHEYAHFLGLRSALFVEEYDLRFCDASIAPRPLVAVQRRRHERSFKGGVVAGTAVLALAVAVVAWKFGDAPRPAQVPAARAASAPVRKPVTPAPARVPSHEPVAQKLLVVSTTGRCWVSVRTGSATGAVVYEGMLERGEVRRFAQRPLWIRFGAPWNAHLRLDGRPVALPTSAGPVNMRFGATAQPA